MHIRRGLPIFVTLVVLACSGLSAAPAPSAELGKLLAEFDVVQRSLRTLSADFTETTTTPLLEEPVVAQGSLFLTKPDAVRWEYRSPEEMRFVIADDYYTGYFPVQKKAERRSVRRWGEQLFRFLGVGLASTELERIYDISLGRSDGSYPDADILVLDPKKRRVKKRVESVKLWIDRESRLPVRVEYRAKNGGTRTVDFTDVKLNPMLSTNLYQLLLPDDVEVTQGFSALSGLGGGDE